MTDDRSKVPKYFKRFPRWAVWMLVLLAVPSLLITLSMMSGKQAGSFPLFSLFWTVVWGGLGAWGLISYYDKPSDAQMDAWTQDAFKGVYARALVKTELDASELIAEPVMISGPRFWDIPPGLDILLGIKKGDDELVRFTPIYVTVINFTPHQLISYQCLLDVMTGQQLCEGTDEYFYRDVVSVSTQTESHSFGGIEVKKLSKGPLG